MPRPPATPITSLDLVLRVANPVWASGRADTVLSLVEWFDNQRPGRAMTQESQRTAH